MTVFFFKNNYYPKAKAGIVFTEEVPFAHENGVAFFTHQAFLPQG